MTNKKNEEQVWNKLRIALNNSYEYNDDWKAAIDLFSSRLDEKFFQPIEKIIKSKEGKGEGFSIVTIQCAIIESLASFRSGKIYTHKIIKNQPKFYYSTSRDMFVDFLHNAIIFKDHFYTIDSKGNKKTEVPFSAIDFYSSVRCGLMHEARTKAAWTINLTTKHAKKEKIFIDETNGNKKLYRTILHYRLKNYLEDYLVELSAVTSEASRLRRFFGRKLDHLYDVMPDPTNFDWWIDK